MTNPYIEESMAEKDFRWLQSQILPSSSLALDIRQCGGAHAISGDDRYAAGKPGTLFNVASTFLYVLKYQELHNLDTGYSLLSVDKKDNGNAIGGYIIHERKFANLIKISNQSGLLPSDIAEENDQTKADYWKQELRSKTKLAYERGRSIVTTERVQADGLVGNTVGYGPKNVAYYQSRLTVGEKTPFFSDFMGEGVIKIH